MSPALKKFLQVGKTIAEAMVPQIATIEVLAKSIPGLHGPAKAKPVIEASVEAILLSEGLSGKDFVEDAKFKRGTAMVNDGFVLIMQAIEERERKAATSGSAVNISDTA